MGRMSWVLPCRPVSCCRFGKDRPDGRIHLAPLTPASFLDRTAAVFADRTAIVDGERRFSYRDMSGRASLISGVKSNLTFELTSDAGTLVLRRPPEGPLLPKAHDMSREAQVQRALAATPVPVPGILFEDAGELIGVPFYVMEKVDGYVVRDTLPAGYAEPEEDRRAIADVLVDTLADLHAVDPNVVGLAGFGRPSGLGERQVRRWSDQWERSKDRDVPAVDELARRLRANPPSGPGGAIVHGDYRLDNCLLARHMPPSVVAVLDWELSTLGEPLADVGLLLFYWRESGEAKPVMTPAPSMLPGFPPRSYLAERYATRTGADLGDLPWSLGTNLASDRTDV